MAIEIESADDCNAVRKAIDIRLDDVILPDATIKMDIYAAFAVENIIGRFPADQEFGDHEASIKTAAILYCASLIAPAMKQVEGEKISGGERRYKAMDFLAKSKELRDRADQIVFRVQEALPANPAPTSSGRPKMFVLAKANRSSRF